MPSADVPYMLENGYEFHSTFERALAAEDRRFASARFARRCPHYFWNFMYFRSGLFGEQVDRYYEQFPRDRFHFTTLYDLQRDPARVLGTIEAFLGVSPAPVGELPRYGSSKGVRSIPLQYVERSVVRRLARHNVPLMKTARRRLNTWNRGSPPTMQPETRARLLADYAADLAPHGTHRDRRARDPGPGSSAGAARGAVHHALVDRAQRRAHPLRRLIDGHLARRVRAPLPLRGLPECLHQRGREIVGRARRNDPTGTGILDRRTECADVGDHGGEVVPERVVKHAALRGERGVRQHREVRRPEQLGFAGRRDPIDLGRHDR